MSTRPPYDLMKDPIYYVSLGLFALLTTALPAFLGQQNFLPLAQTVALTLFLALPLRRRRLSRAMLVLAIWLAIQAAVMFVGTAALPVVFERAIRDGFAFHRTLLEWAVTGEGLPGWILARPLARLGEVAGVLLGSLLTGGLVGIWFLARAVNLFAYAAGRLAAEGATGLLLGLFPWRLLTIAGYAGFVLLLAQPLLNNSWNPAAVIRRQRRLVGVSALLVGLGLLLEIALPPLWQIAWGL